MKTKTEKPEFQVTDRRFWVEDESAIERAPEPPERHPSYVEELKARTELAEQRLRDRLAELDKENDAFRIRLRKDMEKRTEQQKLQFLADFLEIIDNFERALEAAEENSNPTALKEGVRLNLELFYRKLEAAGVEAVDPLGEPFDPHLAEAVGSLLVEDPAQDQRVLDVVHRGYRLGDRLLRPARVRVGVHREELSEEAADADEAPPEGESEVRGSEGEVEG